VGQLGIKVQQQQEEHHKSQAKVLTIRLGLRHLKQQQQQQGPARSRLRRSRTQPRLVQQTAAAKSLQLVGSHSHVLQLTAPLQQEQMLQQHHGPDQSQEGREVCMMGLAQHQCRQQRQRLLPVGVRCSYRRLLVAQKRM
jgi:hypothetical protein